METHLVLSMLQSLDDFVCDSADLVQLLLPDVKQRICKHGESRASVQRLPRPSIRRPGRDASGLLVAGEQTQEFLRLLCPAIMHQCEEFSQSTTDAFGNMGGYDSLSNERFQRDGSFPAIVHDENVVFVVEVVNGGHGDQAAFRNPVTDGFQSFGFKLLHGKSVDKEGSKYRTASPVSRYRKAPSALRSPEMIDQT